MQIKVVIEQRRRHALAADVGDDEPQLAAFGVARIADQEEIVEVAAHLARRLHADVDIEPRDVRKRREGTRQRRLLDDGGGVKLALDALFDLGELLLEGDGHRVDAPGERGELAA